jgi:hypothetical protein
VRLNDAGVGGPFWFEGNKYIEERIFFLRDDSQVQCTKLGVSDDSPQKATFTEHHS